MPVATVRILGSKMMSSGGNPILEQDAVGALADADAVFEGCGLALLVERHDDRRRAVFEHMPGMRTEYSSPSLSEMELTMPLP